MTNKIDKVIFSEAEIEQRVGELAAQISDDYRDKGELVMIGILKGSFIFLADLARRLDIDRIVEFIAVSSYNGASSGAVRLLMDVRADVAGRHVLIVEDIVDTGNTLKYLISVLASRNPASIRTCTLLHKTEATIEDLPIDYVGFPIANEWVVGYGLDYNEFGRTLPYIGCIDPHK